MSYVLGKLVWTVLRPSNLLLLLALLGLVGVWRQQAWGKRLLTAVLGLMALVTVLPVGLWLLAPLEERFPRSAAWPERVDGVVALGATVPIELYAARRQIVLNDTVERLTEWLALGKRYPDAKLVFTGGSIVLDGRVVAEADAVTELARALGVPEARLLLDRNARNTRDNAVEAKALAQPRPGERWLLVTSAAHMPRAIGCFRAVGWDVEPWPVDYRTRWSFELGSELRGGKRLDQLDDAFYEWLGLLYYNALGHSTELYPGPRDT